MRDNYIQHKKILSILPIHFVFVAVDRRKVFDVPGARDAFLRACRTACVQNGITTYSMETEGESVHLYVELPPSISVQEALTKIKRSTASALKKKILKLKDRDNVWSWDALVATEGEFSHDDIAAFVSEHKEVKHRSTLGKGEKEKKARREKGKSLKGGSRGGTKRRK